jgi:hypothetical protein
MHWNPQTEAIRLHLEVWRRARVSARSPPCSRADVRFFTVPSKRRPLNGQAAMAEADRVVLLQCRGGSKSCWKKTRAVPSPTSTSNHQDGNLQTEFQLDPRKSPPPQPLADFDATLLDATLMAGRIAATATGNFSIASFKGLRKFDKSSCKIPSASVSASKRRGKK